MGNKLADEDLPVDIQPSHVRHCIDLLRQVLMCHGDTTLEVVDEAINGVHGFRTPHECIDWEQLKAWTSEQQARQHVEQIVWVHLLNMGEEVTGAKVSVGHGVLRFGHVCLRLSLESHWKQNILSYSIISRTQSKAQNCEVPPKFGFKSDAISSRDTTRYSTDSISASQSTHLWSIGRVLSIGFGWSAHPNVVKVVSAWHIAALRKMSRQWSNLTISHFSKPNPQCLHTCMYIPMWPIFFCNIRMIVFSIVPLPKHFLWCINAR